MPIRTSFLDPSQHVAEGTTVRYTAVLEDETGAAIPASGVTTLTLTLYDLTDTTQPIVNSVDAVNILNTGRGALDASGNLAITFLPADMPILDATHPYEVRLALIEWTYGAGGAKAGRHELQFVVKNLTKVPAA